MKLERTNVEFPLWRKKVDSSLFQHNGTTVPKWACRMWNLERIFPGLKGKKEEESQVTIKFNKHEFTGQITCTWPKKRSDKVYRLWFGDDLKAELKEVFLMSFMRDIEDRLRSEKNSDIEKDIPFWEFLDIEFDEANKTILMGAHYTQEPVFPELFKRLIFSPVLKRIDDELSDKGEFWIHPRWFHKKSVRKSRKTSRIIGCYPVHSPAHSSHIDGPAGRSIVENCRFSRPFQHTDGGETLRPSPPRLPKAGSQSRCPIPLQNRE